MPPPIPNRFLWSRTEGKLGLGVHKMKLLSFDVTSCIVYIPSRGSCMTSSLSLAFGLNFREQSTSFTARDHGY